MMPDMQSLHSKLALNHPTIFEANKKRGAKKMVQHLKKVHWPKPMVQCSGLRPKTLHSATIHQVPV
jgi:hypothetical protein